MRLLKIISLVVLAGPLITGCASEREVKRDFKPSTGVYVPKDEIPPWLQDKVAEGMPEDVAKIVWRIHRVSKSKWRPPRGAKAGLETAVGIVTLPSGELNFVEIARSSGDSKFDLRAYRAVRETFPIEDISGLPPLDYERYLRRFTVTFTMQ